MAPFRILLIIRSFRARDGGAEGYAVTLARTLAELGVEVHILATTGDTPADFPATLHLGELGEGPVLKESLAPCLSIDWGLAVEADLHRLGSSIHQAFLGYNLLSAPAWLRPLKALSQTTPRHRRIIAGQARLLAAPDQHFLAVSAFVAEQVRQHYPAAAPRLHTLHNGIDIHRFRPADPAYKARLKAQLGIRAETLNCLFVAHNLKLKNLRLMEQVFEALEHSHPGAFTLSVFGKRAPKRRAPWLFYGGLQPAERIYGSGDLLVHPTYYDACSNVVLEALACGLPAISSDLNGSAELIESGVDGQVLPVRDKDSASRWRRHLLEYLNPQRRAACSEAARRKAERHDMRSYARALLKLCKDLQA